MAVAVAGIAGAGGTGAVSRRARILVLQPNILCLHPDVQLHLSSGRTMRVADASRSVSASVEFFPSSQHLVSPVYLTAPGLIGLCVDGPRGALVEVNSETDFVARNAKFQDFVEKVLEVALEKAKAGAGAAAAAEVPVMRELNVHDLLQAEHPGLHDG